MCAMWGLYDGYISIHAAQEGCDSLFNSVFIFLFVISIHAAQEGCDHYNRLTEDIEIISIHAAQEGCDRSA